VHEVEEVDRVELAGRLEARGIGDLVADVREAEPRRAGARGCDATRVDVAAEEAAPRRAKKSEKRPKPQPMSSTSPWRGRYCPISSRKLWRKIAKRTSA